MKVFKKVMILTVAILSLSSTVAFGAGNCTESSSAAVNANPNSGIAGTSGSSQQPSGTSAGAATGTTAAPH